MAINPTLFKAILSMDAYNRGYNAGIKFGNSTADYSTDTSRTQIGTATIFDRKGDASALSIGFYALGYSYNGETVISYRGE